MSTSFTALSFLAFALREDLFDGEAEIDKHSSGSVTSFLMRARFLGDGLDSLCRVCLFPSLFVVSAIASPNSGFTAIFAEV